MPPTYDEEVLEQLLAADDGTPDYRNDGLSMAEHAQGYGRLRPLDTLPPGRPAPPPNGQPGYLFVYDLETTGLDPAVDVILEIGACLVDAATLDLVDEIQLVASLPGGPAWWDEHVPPMAREMHEHNGLYTAARQSNLTIEFIDVHVVEWLRQRTGSTKPVAGAGSGVATFDSRFVHAYMPALERALTYWSHDVGHIRRQCELAGRSDLVHTQPGGKEHRALSDARLHLDELRWYRRLVQSIPYGIDPTPTPTTGGPTP